TSGAVHVCQGRGPTLWSGTSDRVHVTQFRNGGGWGLPGTHVHKLYPANTDRAIWTIGYQDVAAIGTFVASGRYDPIRTVSIMTLGAKSRTVQVPIGADLHSFFEDETGRHPGAACLISGSATHGREAGYLGRYDDEATMTKAPARRAFKFPLPIMPTAALDRAIPMNLLTVPLMRALSIGDVQTCEKLGCLDLLEQDVAILSALCTSGEDYGARLREVLTQLKEQSA
ncbi:MAG: hypothetical protein KJN93_07080, partial [Alphaproteobacteria bacterium]|nr:hypothetical protein [Alphaproteobacteria bacterium]